MKPNRVRAFFFALLACIIVSACDSSAQSPLTVLTIGTADNGGTMYPVGSAIANAVTARNSDIKINVGASSGSTRNVQALLSGEIDLGLVSGDTAWAAAHGLYEFDEPQEGLRAIAAVYSSTSNWIAPASLGAEYVHDLRGRKIGIGPQESTTEFSALIAIGRLGLENGETILENCSLSSGAQEIAAGNLDALHGFTGVPVGSLAELAEALPCRILRYTDAELQDILEMNPFYYRATIPAGIFVGQEKPVDTFGVKCLLCVDASMDPELVYALTRALWDSREELGGVHPSMQVLQEEGFACEALPIPLHEGATRFYQETGLLLS